MMSEAGSLVIVERSPTVEEYEALRASVGWYAVDRVAASTGLSRSLYSVCAVAEHRTIGCGRVVGDGGLYLYIQDIIVLPEYQRRGVGRSLMAHVMDFIARSARENTFVGLMAAKGVAEFYRPYGFEERSPDRPGMFRLWSERPSATGRVT
jgi:ribosomal protein S18 acetylase RimI-like enzyme